MGSGTDANEEARVVGRVATPVASLSGERKPVGFDVGGSATGRGDVARGVSDGEGMEGMSGWALAPSSGLVRLGVTTAFLSLP